MLFDSPLFLAGVAQRVFELACHQAVARTRIRAARFGSEKDFIDLMSAQPSLARVLPEVLRLIGFSSS